MLALFSNYSLNDTNRINDTGNNQKYKIGNVKINVETKQKKH